MSFPVFASGDVLNASDMNAVGLWLVKTQTVGSGVSSVTVTGAFSADYDNYRIIYTNGTSSNTASLNLRLGAATTNYANSTVYTIFASGVIGSTFNNGGSSFVYAGATDATNGTFLTVDVFSPFLTRNTGYGGSFIVTDVAGHSGGIHKTATSYADFTIIPGAGTLTGGTIRVYGYRN
jgi:hypothetical protein